MTMFEKLKPHIGHKLACAYYGDPVEPQDVCIVCDDCHEILISAEVEDISELCEVSVKPEKKHGYWKTSYDPFEQAASIKCSQCGFSTYYEGQTTFPHECPNCGVMMEDDI